MSVVLNILFLHTCMHIIFADLSDYGKVIVYLYGIETLIMSLVMQLYYTSKFNQSFHVKYKKCAT